MPRFPFTRDPAWVTIGEGISLAFAQWRATAVWWVIPVLLMGLLTGLVNGLTVTSVQALPVDAYVTDTGIDWAALFGPLLPGFIFSTVVVGTVSMVARWVYLALLVAGLRGGDVRAGWVVQRGLRTIVADLVMSLALAAFAFIGIGSFIVNPALGILLGLIAFVVWVAITIRVVFWQVAIFDGAGVAEGLLRSLLLTRSSWERMIGWGAAAFGLSLLVGIPFAILGAILGDASVIGSGIKATAQEAFAVFDLFLLGVLYESQRRRIVPEIERPSLAKREPDAGSPSDPTEGTSPPPPPPPPAQADPWRS